MQVELALEEHLEQVGRALRRFGTGMHHLGQALVVVLLQLATKATAVYLLVSFAFAVAGIAALIAGHEAVLVGLAAACFVGFEILLPHIARAYSPFSGGVRVWLGMRKSAA